MSEKPRLIKLNGQDYSLNRDARVVDLVEDLSLKLDGLVVELNGEIIDQKNFASTFLKTGDRVELISFVGGG